MSRQRGAVLATTLILALLVLMLGVAAARASSHAQKSSRFLREHQAAFAAAEAALADAERDVAGSNPGSPGRQSLFATAPLGFGERCGRGADDLGLCTAKAEPRAPDWQTVDLAHDDSQTVAFGAYTGARMAEGEGPLSARPPRYLIELVSPPGAGTGSGSFYRVTAIGFGERDGMQVVLQSYYHRPPESPGGGDAAGQGSPAPSGRISWREVANWPELHRLATK